jgi:hypothetical protein
MSEVKYDMKERKVGWKSEKPSVMMEASVRILVIVRE